MAPFVRTLALTLCCLFVPAAQAAAYYVATPLARVVQADGPVEGSPEAPAEGPVEGPPEAPGGGQSGSGQLSLTYNGYLEQPIENFGQFVVFLSNQGEGDLSLVSIQVSAGQPQFQLQSNDCPAVLGAGDSCAVEVSFMSTEANEYMGALEVATSEGISYATLTGVTMVEDLEALAVWDVPLFVGANPYGNTDTVFRLHNEGTVAVAINNISLAGDAAFSLRDNFCPAVLAAGDSCFVTLRLESLSLGFYNTRLTVDSSARVEEFDIQGEVSKSY